MPVESWMKPEDAPALAAEATALIDAVLGRLPETDRTAFWASIRKCYNTPYNDPTARALPVRDTMEASATRAHNAASITELPNSGASIAELSSVAINMGAIVGAPAFGAEAHPA